MSTFPLSPHPLNNHLRHPATEVGVAAVDTPPPAEGAFLNSKLSYNIYIYIYIYIYIHGALTTYYIFQIVQ